MLKIGEAMGMEVYVSDSVPNGQVFILDDLSMSFDPKKSAVIDIKPRNNLARNNILYGTFMIALIIANYFIWMWALVWSWA